MTKNKQALHQRIDDWFNTHTDEMIEDLAALVEINSVRGEAEPGAPYGAAPKAVLNLAARMLESHGLSVVNFEDRMISADIGSGAAELAILAHLDVVGVSDGWESDPFTLTERDGMLFGRGTSDDKGPATAAMYAMYAAAEINPALKKRCRIILGSAEETGCEDIGIYTAKNEMPPCVFSPDSNFPVVNTEKGRFVAEFSAKWDDSGELPRVTEITGGDTANIVPKVATAVVQGVDMGELVRLCREYSEKTGAQITAEGYNGTAIIAAEGVSAHASHPESGINAQTALLSLLAALPLAPGGAASYIKKLSELFPHGDWNGDAMSVKMADEISGELTLNFGVLKLNQGGFTANFDSRTPACADDADLPARVRATLTDAGLTVDDIDATKCHHTPADGPFVKTLLEIYEDYSDLPGECLALGGSTYVHGIPGGVAFGCELPGIDNRIHGANEFIGRDQLVMSAKMFTRAILEICE